MVVLPEKIGHDPVGTAPTSAPPAYSQATGDSGHSSGEPLPYPTPPSSHGYPPLRTPSRESQTISSPPPVHIIAPDNPGHSHGRRTPHQEYFSPQQPYPLNPNIQQPPYNVSEAELQRGRDYQAMLLAKCAEGLHDYSTSYGIVGILSAVICFPCGIVGLFIDQERKCVRCGHIPA